MVEQYTDGTAECLEHCPTMRPVAEVGFSQAHADMGIARSVVEVFRVGEYRYSKLEDAIAQARRMAA